MKTGHLVAALALSLAACRSASTATVVSAEPIELTAEQVADATPPRPAAIVRGVAHAAGIDRLAVCPDGTCALTRDSAGSVRIWPSLDGSLEPQPIAADEPQQLSIAAGSDGFTVALVASTGGVRLARVNRDGTEVESTGDVSPFERAVAAEVVPGADVVVSLHADGTIRVLRPSGVEIGRFDERRFQPSAIRVSEDGRYVVALVGPSGAAQERQIEVVRLALRVDPIAATLERDGVPRIIGPVPEQFHPGQWAVSSDGRYVLTTTRDKLNQAHVRVDFTQDTPPERVLSPIRHNHAVVGFVEGRGFANTNDGLSWALDFEAEAVRPGLAPPPNHRGLLEHRQLRAGIEVQPYGSYLFVHQVAARQQYFLGHVDARLNEGDSNPAGTRVAWLSGDGDVFIEPMTGGPARRLASVDPRWSTRFARFVDDAWLVVISRTGRIALVDIERDELVGEAGFPGIVEAVQVEPRTGQVLLTSSRNQLLFELDRKTSSLAGPYLISDDALRQRLLAPSSPDGPVLWTLDRNNRQRFYTLAQLRDGLTRRETEAVAIPWETDQPIPLAVDAQGHTMGARLREGHTTLFVETAMGVHDVDSPFPRVTSMVPSPDGRLAVFIGEQRTMGLLDVDALEVRWTKGHHAAVPHVAWSADGATLVLAGPHGGAIVDAASGEILSRRCGMAFERAASPPEGAFQLAGSISMCEAGEISQRHDVDSSG